MNLEEFNPALVEEEKLIDLEEAKVGASDSIKMYLIEIGRIPLLDYETEIELSKAIAIGNSAKQEKDEIDQSNKDNISLEYYKELEEKISKRDIAIDKMISSNLRLVVSIAKHYYLDNLDLMDLVQEGSMGLMHAAMKYDYTKGYRFSTYATWWIRQSISRAISDQARTIRLPVHIGEEIRRLRKARNLYFKENGIEATIEELANQTGFSEDKILKLDSYKNDTVSMDTIVGNEEDSTLGDFIPDNNIKSPLEYSIEKALKKDINDCLDQILTEREKLVIIHRFGLNGNTPKTLEEIASLGSVKVTRERVRQIEAKALVKLKRNKELLKMLHAYHS
ncbi:MAG: sigma-70 family RNA polymerase sigma factor [Acholeplasmatales bacterium]|nr:sigma-70 family RNA polymerase sigma factor [Acholeplasmatales bacterium]